MESLFKGALSGLKAPDFSAECIIQEIAVASIHSQPTAEACVAHLTDQIARFPMDCQGEQAGCDVLRMDQ